MNTRDFLLGRVSAAPRTKVLNDPIPLVAGLMTTVPTFGLLPPVAFSTSGTWSGYSLDASTGALSSSVTRTAGQAVTLTGKVTGADGCAVTFTGNFTAQSVLGPSTASFVVGATAGTTIAAITGLNAGETLTGVVPNDGRLAVSSANLVVGLTASSAGTISATVTTSAGRTLAIAVTVSSAPANTRNWLAASLPKTQAGLGRVRAGTGNMLAVMFGDSRGRGVGTDNAHSPAAIMAARLQTKWGVPVNTNSIFGWGSNTSTAAAMAAFDSRVTYTGTPSGSFNTFGGFGFRLNASGQSYTFAMAQGDAWKLYWNQFNGTAGTFNLYVDGVLDSNSPFNTNTTTGIREYILSLADTTHTFKVEWVSGTVTFCGIRGSRTSVKAVELISGGCAGAATTDWNAGGTVLMRDVLTKIGAADLYIPNLITNDENANADPATTYTTSYTSLLNYCRTTMGGDVILVTAAWEQPTGTVTQIRQQAYRDALAAISDSLTIPLYDLRGRYPDWSAQNTAGEMSTNVHENATGYSNEFTPIADAVVAIIP